MRRRRRRFSKPGRKSRRDGSQTGVRAIVAAGLLGALLLLSALPFGGVSSWAADAILLACLAVLAAMSFTRSERACDGTENAHDAARCASRLLRAAALCLLAWALAQMLPLPGNLVRALQPGWRLLPETAASQNGKWSALALDRAGGWYSLGLWVAPAAIAAATAAAFRSRQAARLLAHVIAAVGTFQAFAALIIPGIESSWWAGFRATRLRGTFSGPNAFGGFMALTVPVTLGLLLTLYTRLIEVSGGKWKRLPTLPSQHHGLLMETVWVFLSLLAQAVALIGSGSRGAVLATVTPSLVLFGGYVFAFRGPRRATLQLAALILFAVVAMATGGGLYLLLQRFDTGVLLDRGLPGRFALWEAALQLIGAFPFGVGPGAFPGLFTVFQPETMGGFRVDHAHNDYLQWVGEFGVPGAIALAVILAALLTRAAGTFRINGVRNSAWIWRGAAVAVVAALTHAVVDFNLTARPAVRVLFFVVCGLMLGAPRRTASPERDIRTEPVRRSADDARADRVRMRRRRGRGVPVTVFIVIPALVLAAIPTAGRMRAARDLEGARVALGLPADPYFWMPPPWTAPQRAIDVISGVSARRPRVARFRASLATAKLAGHALDRQAAINAAREDLMFYSAADFKRITAMIDLGMAWQWRRTVDEVLELAKQSVRLNPWNADFRTLAAEMHARAALIEGAHPDGAAHRDAALRETRVALRLAPYDPRVLTETCRTLAEVHNAALTAGDRECAAAAAETLVDIGRLAVRLNAGATTAVLAAWESAGLLGAQLRDLSGQPLPVLREVYRYFSRNLNVEGARRTLDQMLLAYTREFRAPSAGMRLWLAREEYRWMLRGGAWSDYRAALPARRELWRRRQRIELEAVASGTAADLSRRLRLRDVDYRIGLTAANLLSLARLEWDRGAYDVALGLLSRALALGCALPDSDPAATAAAADLLKAAGQMRDRYPLAWLIARLAYARGESRSAAHQYARVLENVLLPLRFRHRIRLEAAAAWHAAGNTAAALRQLEKALSEAPDDPEVLGAWIEHGHSTKSFRDARGFYVSVEEHVEKLKPDIGLDMLFMGERIKLSGFSIDPYGAAQRAGTRLRLFFRFADRVPADLAVNVVADDADGYVFFRRTVMLGRELPRSFSAGEPLAGARIFLDVLLPPRAQAAGRLSVRLVSERRRVNSDEGLSGLEIMDWTRYIDVERAGAP